MNRSIHNSICLFSSYLILIIAVVGLSAGVVRAQPGSALQMQREIVALTNKARQQAGLKPLQVKGVLTLVAQKHAINMASQNKMSHILDGKGPADRMRDAGYRFSRCGENIAYSTKSSTARDVFNGWMNSPGHRANILNPNFTEMSFGRAMSGRTSYYYFCQAFGSP